jgi:hypothetical protein
MNCAGFIRATCPTSLQSHVLPVHYPERTEEQLNPAMFEQAFRNIDDVLWKQAEWPLRLTQELDQLMRTGHPARIMIWEDAPLASTRGRLEAMGVVVVPYRTVYNRPESGDYFDVMASNLANIAGADRY